MSRKKLINPFTGKEDYFCSYNDAAEHVGLTIGQLKYRYTEDCTLHQTLIPKRSCLHGRFGFWLLDLDHYKNNNIGLIRKSKEKVTEVSETAEVFDLKRS